MFGYIFTKRIQPFEAANISAAFFLGRPTRKHSSCHTFFNKFQDDILCALAMYSYMWDWLYFLNLYIGERLEYIYTLLVCPVVTKKRQNSRTDRAQNFWGNSLDPRKCLYILQNTKKKYKSFEFCKILKIYKKYF